MYSTVAMALCATLFTWFVTALGAAVVLFFKNPRQMQLDLLLGFAAGVMIAASFWSLLQPAIELASELGAAPWLIATPGFICGAAFMWAADKAVSLARRQNALPCDEGGRRHFLLILSITLHNIPEGLAVGVAFGALGAGGYSDEALMAAIGVAVGIALQNFPEGAAVSLPLRRDGLSRKRSFLLGQASAMVEPLAALLGALLVLHVQQLLPFALAFAAGAMILVAVHELIPECQAERGSSPYCSTMGILAGFSVMMLLDVALG